MGFVIIIINVKRGLGQWDESSVMFRKLVEVGRFTLGGKITLQKGGCYNKMSYICKEILEVKATLV